MTRIFLIVFVLALMGVLVFVLREDREEEEVVVLGVSYPDEILPILRENCAGCHSVNSDLVNLEGDLTQLSRPLIVPGQPGNSPLWLQLVTARESYHRLPVEKMELVRRWILTDGRLGVLWSERPLRAAEKFGDVVVEESVLMKRLEEIFRQVTGEGLSEAVRAEVAFGAGSGEAVSEVVEKVFSAEVLGDRLVGFWLRGAGERSSGLFVDWLERAMKEDRAYPELVEVLLAGDQVGDALPTHFLSLDVFSAGDLGKFFLGEPEAARFVELFGEEALLFGDRPYFSENQMLTAAVLLKTEDGLRVRREDLERRRDPLFQSWLLEEERFATIPDLAALYPLDELEGPRESVGLDEASPALPWSKVPEEGEEGLSPTFANIPGVQGLAPKFDGRNLLVIPGSFPISPYRAFSMAFWIRFEELREGPRVILSSTSSDPPADLLLMAAGKRLQVSLRDRRNLTPPLGAFSGDLSLEAKRWHHLALVNAGTRRSGSLRLFLDGREVEATPINTPPVSEVKDPRPLLFLGGRPGNLGMEDGALDEFHLYLRGLTEPEIAHLSNRRLLTTSAAPIDEMKSYFFSSLVAETRAIQDDLDLLREELALLHGRIDQVAVAMGGGQEIRRLEFLRELFQDRPERLARVLVLRIQDDFLGSSLSATPFDLSRTGALPFDSVRLDHLARTLIESGWSLQALCREMIRLELVAPSPETSTIL